MKKITKNQAKKLIANSNGAFFSVDFITKSGEKRTMTCRLGVTKHLKGGQLAFDPTQYGYQVVYDTTVGGYRMVNLKTLKRLAINGKQFKVA